MQNKVCLVLKETEGNIGRQKMRDGDAAAMGRCRASQAERGCIDFEAVLSVQTGGIVIKP
jgi:hypothetical protein